VVGPVFLRVRSSRVRLLVASCVSVGLSGCGPTAYVRKKIFGGDDTAPKILGGFIGGVVADEPRAALTAKQVLATGGDAADAAVTLGFMLATTLPSRAGLGGGGACVAYQPGTDTPNKGVPEAIMFVPRAPAAGGGDRPAAVPMLARGLYLLSARYGTRNFAALVAPAEEAARFGIPVSRALAVDLAPVMAPLTADPGAAAVFAPGGVPLTEGITLRQPDLAETFAQIRTLGVGDLYSGILGQKVAASATAAGGAFTSMDLRRAVAALETPINTSVGNDQVSFVPLPADGGLAATAALRVLQHDPGATQAADAAAQGAAARARSEAGATADTILAQAGAAPALPSLPASTSFLVVDRKGGAVACALTMNNLFGTGRIAPGTGILLAASPAAKPAPLLAAGIAWNENIHAFRAAVGASGQNGAGLAAGYAMAGTLSGGSSPVPDPGRANVASCPGYLPGAPQTCRFTVDPRIAGLAVGSD
jgi:gamma-glutamyltranspeptidase/glutathione hydrolase